MKDFISVFFYLESFLKVRIFLVILFLSAAYFPVLAQEFGRNKVQYENFDFDVLKSENFDILYYINDKDIIYDAALMLERWNTRFTGIFGKPVGPEQPIILYANHADFQQTNVISGFISQGTGGVTEGLRNRIIIPLTGVYQENDHVLGHELVHSFQYNLIKEGADLRAAGAFPLWFIEGLAEYLSIGRKDALTAMWMRDAVLNDDVPSIDDVSRNYKYFPYRFGHSLWAYITGLYGDSVIVKLYTSILASNWETGFEKTLGIDPDSVSNMWMREIKDVYGKQIEGKTKPSETGKVLRAEEDGINLSPVVSPDGKYIALFTRDDLFSLNLFLADAATGELIRKLATSDTDRHFDALRFINSSGAWSPDGSSFAFVVIEDGDDQVAITDINTGELVREIRIKDVTEISGIAWSPDNKYLLIAGTSEGTGDLYLYSFETKKTEQLTDDKFAELHPSWSSDGRKIVFSTDRGDEEDFNNLNFNPLNLGIMDFESRDIDIISVSKEVKHINPFFSQDNKNIYFISDPDGFSNVYRYSLEAKELFKLTNIATGVSGLTALSPAMSVSKNGLIIFTAFDKASYNLYSADLNELEEKNIVFDAALLDSVISMPPAAAADSGYVEEYLSAPAAGLKADPKFNIADYSPSLGLIFVGQVGLGFGVSQFGTGVAGGVSMLFSDMLGEHMLGVEAQVSGGLKDIGAMVTYLNRERRLHWGGFVSHIPYLTGFVGSGVDTVEVGGQPVLARKIIFVRQRVFSTTAMPFLEYPLSMNRRIEFGLGYNRIGYDIEEESILTSGGIIIGQEERELDAPPALNMFQTYAAYIGDYSFFAFTSPIDGSRYRLQVENSFGSLNFMTALADYRHYFFFNPFTLALRGFHFGRYLHDAEDPRLAPLVLGYDTWVRGYSINDFEVEECSETGDPNDCPEFDRLIGSRVGVFNVEFRIPLFGTEQFGLINFPYLPTEFSLFFDSGVAWTDDEKPVLKFEERSIERVPVFSAGLAARVNLLGFVVPQFYYVFPFQRPDKGAHFGFIIAPGW